MADSDVGMWAVTNGSGLGGGTENIETLCAEVL